MVGTLGSRKERIAKALRRLAGKKPLALRDFTAIVGKQGKNEYERRWKEEKKQRAALYGEKPDAIIEYEAFLHRADFEYNRAEALASATKRKRDHSRMAAASEAYRRSETLFEKALCWLDEVLTTDPQVAVWLDRHVSFEEAEYPILDREGVPRTVTSRSQYRRQGPHSTSKAEIKRAILDEHLARIEMEERLLQEALQRKDKDEKRLLKERLAKLRRAQTAFG